jgi:hypothetical protein
VRLKLTYTVVNTTLDTDRETEIVSAYQYGTITDEFMDALAAVQSKCEELHNVTIDTGGDDEWHELNIPDVVTEDELAETETKFKSILKEVEDALKQFCLVATSSTHPIT